MQITVSNFQSLAKKKTLKLLKFFSFATQAILNSHIRGIHEGAYNQVCEICAKQFTSKKYYEEHKLYIHSMNPPPKVQCPNCGNWMRDSSVSIIHARVSYMLFQFNWFLDAFTCPQLSWATREGNTCL
jgi:hypothetical protein